MSKGKRRKNRNRIFGKAFRRGTTRFRRRRRNRGLRSGSLVAAWAVSVFSFCFFAQQGPDIMKYIDYDYIVSSCVKSAVPAAADSLSVSGGNRDELSVINDIIGSAANCAETSEMTTVVESGNEQSDSSVIPLLFNAVNDISLNAANGSNAGNAEVNAQLIVSSTVSLPDSPQVIIYHTHATESYMPVSNDNSHSQDKYATVREAGNVLVNRLMQKGIPAVQDETLHDYPSYNKSYGRSLETAKAMIKKYPDAKIIIDLHRDAASSAGNKPKTVKINGETVSSFCLVVGTANDNVTQLRNFASHIIKTANSMYPGFGTNIIEKEYKFNGYLSDHFLLLELGNNLNTIEQVNKSAVYFADVLEAVLMEMQNG